MKTRVTKEHVNLKRLLFQCLLLLGLFSSFTATASHLAGGDIEYKCIGFRRWEISLVIYRDCNGIPMPGCTGTGVTNCTKTITVKPMATIAGGGLNPNGCSAPVPSISVTVTSWKVEDIGKSTQAICGQLAKNICDNRGTSGPGTYNPSLEGYYYKGILDMSSPVFNNACPYWEVVWSECCRNNGTENILNAGGVDFYISAVINIFWNQGPGNCKNNSPEIRNEAVAIVCSSQEIVFNMGAVDPDRDSLTYAVGRSRGAGGGFATTIPPYGPTYPFPLNSGSPPHTNYPQPNGPYVIIDSVTGDISFNALNNSPTLVIFGCINVEITQWNYDVNGNPYIVGRTQRELQVYVRSCPNNNPPKFATSPALPNGNAKYNWSVCAGEQICFTITAKDIDDGPGPEIPTKLDSTFISWNSGINRPGKLTFLPDYSPSVKPRPVREDRWKFCWQTEDADGATLPYYFTVTGTDNNCPNVGRVTRAFGITVVPVPETSGTKVDMFCGKWRYEVRKTKPKQTFATARLEIAKEPYDYGFTYGAFVTVSPNPNPPAVGSPTAPRLILSDTVSFTKGGKYLVKYTVTIPGVEAGQQCTKISYDTLTIDTQVVGFTRDTFVCKFKNMTITGSAKWGTAPYTYRWYRSNTLGSPVNGPNFQTGFNYLASDTQTTQYILQVQDIKGCKHLDTMTLEVKQLPVPLFVTDSMRICSYENFVLDAGNNKGNIRKYEWYRNGTLQFTDSTQSVTKSDSGLYVVFHVDTFGCRQSDTFNLYVNQPVIANAGIDTAACPGDTVKLMAKGGQKYKWERIQGSSLVTLVPYGTVDSVRVNVSSSSFAGAFNDYVLTSYVSYPNPSTTYKECKNSDTVRVSTRVFPILTRPAMRDICRALDTLILPNFTVNPASQGQANGGVGVWSYAPKPAALLPTSGLPSLLVDSLASLPPDTFFANIANNTSNARINWLRYSYKGPASTGGCVRTDSAAVRVFAQPKIDAGATVHRCISAGIYQLNASGGHVHSPRDASGRSGVWSTIQGGGLVSTTSGLNTIFTFNPLAAGVNLVPQFNLLGYTYTIGYNSNSLQCVSVDTLRINVIKPPEVNAGANVTICKNEPTFLISTKSGATTTSTIPGSSFWTMAPGQIPNISNAMADSQSFNSQNGSVPDAGGKWKLYYRDVSSGCEARDSMELTVRQLPKVSLTSFRDSLCKTDLTVQLTGTVTPLVSGTGVYMGPGINTNTGLVNIQDALVIAETSPEYSYKFTDIAGCADSVKRSIFIQAPPVLNLDPSTNAILYKCATDPTPFKLISTISPTRYGVRWSTTGTGTFSASTQASTDYTFSTADALAQVIMTTVTSTSNNSICAAVSKNVELHIDPTPNPDFTYDSAGCEPYTSKFVAKGAGVPGSTYAWFFGSIDTVSKDSSFNHTYSTWGNVPVRLVVSTPAKCTAEQSGLVRVYSIPEADFEFDPPFTTIASPVFNFTNKSTSPDGSLIKDYEWNFGPDPAKSGSTVDRLVYDVESPKSIPFAPEEGEQPVVLKVTTQRGCTDTAIRMVRIEPDITVFIPSAFMPKEGGNNVPCADPTFSDCNDVFRVYAAGFKTIEVYVFNRWGQQVFSTTNPDIGWNGKINNEGAICPQDVYIYQINATSFNDKKYNYSGSITLLR